VKLSDASRIVLRQHLDGRLAGMRSDRYSWWAHWASLAEVFLPRRYKWFVTPNQGNRGSQINQAIIDETGVLAARTLASGMMSGMTSPTKAWFSLGLHDLEYIPYGPVKSWLAEVERRILRVLSASNFYTSLATLYHELGVFGSGALIIYEDPEQVIRVFNPCLGEFYFALNGKNEVDTLAREYTYTIKQTVDEFGLENCTASTQQAYKQGGANLQREIVICHTIEPNFPLWKDTTELLGYAVPKKFKYREIYWEQADGNKSYLRCTGYNEKPFVGGRWDVVSNDAYGRSPGMDGLPAVKQLQVEQKRKGEGIDKLVRPPMVASVSMKNEPNSILPGAVNYVADMSQAGFKPAYQIDLRLNEMMLDIKEVQDRVKEVFFVDLFMMISQLDTVRTATEIDARREEKLVQLGPVIERFENEVLDPIIERVFSIMDRRGLLPELPEELRGQTINVQYVSMLAEAQAAAKTSGTERFLSLIGNLAGVDQSVLDVVDFDELAADYANNLNITPRGIRSPDDIAALRAKREQQAQQEQAMQASLAAVQGAKNLSDTNVGGGQNALQLMTGLQ
jgi:hypothetical protein